MYKCSLCDYSTVRKYNYQKHVNSKKHIIKMKTEFSCEKCNYRTNKKSNMDRHNASKKHLSKFDNSHETIETFSYNCVSCNYHTNKLYDYNRHLITKKHINNQTSDEQVDVKQSISTEDAKTKFLDLVNQIILLIQNL